MARFTSIRLGSGKILVLNYAWKVSVEDLLANDCNLDLILWLLLDITEGQGKRVCILVGMAELCAPTQLAPEEREPVGRGSPCKDGEPGGICLCTIGISRHNTVESKRGVTSVTWAMEPPGERVDNVTAVMSQGNVTAVMSQGNVMAAMSQGDVAAFATMIPISQAALDFPYPYSIYIQWGNL